MDITSRIPDHAIIVEAVAEGFILAAMVMIQAGVVPMFPHDANVRYQEEPAGSEDWKLPDRVVSDGWGDCEDLVFWTCAGLRLSGEDPEARLRVVRVAKNKLHAVVLRGDGSIDDPSLDLVDKYGGRRAH